MLGEFVLTPLWSYFDPGSGSLVLQMLVGGSAGLVVFGRYLWNSLPTLFSNRRMHSTVASMSDSEIPIQR